MKLLKSMAQAFSTVRSGTSGLSTVAQQWLRGNEDESLRLLAPYQQSAWIYVAVSVLAETVANIPFRLSVGRGTGERPVESGPLHDLLQNPHPTMSRALFWQTLVSWEALRGEFFIAPLDRNGQPVAVGREFAEKPVQLLPLNPDCFSEMIHRNSLTGWRYKGMNGMTPLANQVLLPEEVIFARNFNPYYFWRGLSPLTVAMLPATADYAAEQFMKGLMLSNGDAGLIITTEEMLNDAQREQLLSAIESRRRRVGTANRPLFLWGDMKVESATISNVDSEFLEHRKLNRQEIGSIFKVPESMMGFAGQKSALSAGSAIEQDRLNFIENTISGICHRLEAALDPLVKSFDRSLYGWFDLDSLPILQAARRDRISTAQKAFAMGVPFNQINQVYDLGFEPVPWGNRGYLNRNLQEAGEVEVPAPVAETPASSSAGLPVERMLKLLEAPCPIAEPVENKALVGKLKRFFFEQRGRALESVETMVSEGRDRPVLDLQKENEALLARIGSVLPEGTVRARAMAEAVNRKTLSALDAVVAESMGREEEPEQMPGRIKALFQELSDGAGELAGQW